MILIPGLALAAASVAYGVMSSNKTLSQTAQQPQQVQPQSKQERPEAVRVPEARSPSNEVRKPHKVLEEVGLEPLTDERIEAGESQNNPA